MDIEAFLLCDAATDQYGKLNVLGAFDAIVGQKLPVVHPQLAVALRIRFKKSESANHPFRINIIDEDGKSILVKVDEKGKPVARPFDGNVSVRIGDAEEFAVVNLIVNFRDMRFERFGRYSVDLTMDGNARGSLPLFIKPIQAGPGRP